MMHTLNDIAYHPPAEVGFQNGNEGILHEYGLDGVIQIQHDGDDLCQDDDIKENSPGNLPKVLLIY